MHVARMDWSMNVLTDWHCTSKVDGLEIHRPDGYGRLSLHSITRTTPALDFDLMYTACQHGYDIDTAERVTHGQFKGFQFRITEESSSVRHVYLRSGYLMLQATYECRFVERCLEDRDIDQMLDSLNLT